MTCLCFVRLNSAAFSTFCCRTLGSTGSRDKQTKWKIMWINNKEPGIYREQLRNYNNKIYIEYLLLFQYRMAIGSWLFQKIEQNKYQWGNLLFTVWPISGVFMNHFFSIYFVFYFILFLLGSNGMTLCFRDYTFFKERVIGTYDIIKLE